MELNDNIQIQIFKKAVDEVADKDTFTHYWNNKEENFPDCTNIETYLNKYIESGNYDWFTIQDATRFTRSKILNATLTLNVEDRLSVDQVFVKVSYKDGSEIPQYYYGTEIDVMTNQNNPTNDYTLVLELDMWSTFGCKLHGLMKDESMVQQFLCNRKMMDRFKYQELVDEEWVDCDTFVNDGKHRLGVNYMTQPWLLNSGSYKYPLIQATDNLTKEKGDIVGMSLLEWLNMNGCTIGEDSQWEFWKNHGSISYIKCKDQYSEHEEGMSEQEGNDGYVYNQNEIDLNKTDFRDLIQDNMFNSNGKYRYMIVKFGSNNCWSYKIDESDENKTDAFNRAKLQLYYIDTEGKKVWYTDLQNLLSEIVFNGGGQCINTKRVEGIKSNSSSYETIHLNGESICLIPIPKGQYEQLYLFYLNSHDKGIVLGDGTILGMVVNDIPPSIFAAALRKYNDELNDSNMQTIGDKLSLVTSKEDTKETKTKLPFAWTSLRLDGNWDWNPTIMYSGLNARILQIQDPQQGLLLQPIFSGKGWYTEYSGSGIITWSYKFSNTSSMQEGYYMLPPNIIITSPSPAYGFTQPKWRLSFDIVSKWHNGNIDTLTWEDFTKYGTDEAGCTKAIREWLFPRMAYFYFDGGNPDEESNWHLISGANTDYCKSGAYKIIDTEIIPPVSSESGKYYRDTSSTTINYEELYYNSDSSHYFPTIFHDFSYIPITVARKNEGKMEGQSNWFNVFENMLTKEDIYSINSRYSEPFLWGPEFYQWVYYNDGLSKITLTADQIDWFKTYEDSWNINLRTNVTSTTNFKLDIADIVNDNYPFSRSTTEFIVNDNNKYPFTTEAYNNWYQQNAVSEATSKRAKDITNEYSRARYPMTAGMNLLSSTIGGAAAGATMGPWGALAGLIIGGASGGASWGVGKLKLENEIAEADKKWANDWAGQYGNLYGQPASIVTDGFTSGSLLYTPNGPGWDEDKQKFELFKMFTINPEARDAIAQEVFTSGLPYMRMCKYSDYDNRVNFNIVNFNLNEKDAIVNNYLKREFSKETLMFSQQQFIDWFKAKCKSKMRLFIANFDVDNMDTLIETNIEKSMTVNKK